MQTLTTLLSLSALIAVAACASDRVAKTPPVPQNGSSAPRPLTVDPDSCRHPPRGTYCP